MGSAKYWPGLSPRRNASRGMLNVTAILPPGKSASGAARRPSADSLVSAFLSLLAVTSVLIVSVIIIVAIVIITNGVVIMVLLLFC